MLIVLTVIGALLNEILMQRCVAAPLNSYRSVTIPFTALQSDNDFAPHQVVTVLIRKDKLSPAVSAKFVFDTGTSWCAITSSLADKLNLTRHRIHGQIGGNLMFDGVTGLAVTPASLDVGTLQVRSCPLLILSSRQPTTIAEQPIDGILGANFWSSFVVHLDFAHSQITFTVPAVNPLPFDKLNQNPVFVPESEIARQGFGTALAVPVLTFAGGTYAAASLNNGPTDTPDFLLVDSGSDASFLSKPTQRKLNLRSIGTGTFSGIGERSADNKAWLPGLTCGALKLNNLVVYLAVAPNLPQSSSILGLDILANYDILWDFPHQKMYLNPRSDLRAVTTHQYQAAPPVQRQQWAKKKLIIRYPAVSNNFGFAVLYTSTPDGLPLAQVRPDAKTPFSSFLLKSNTHNVFVSSALSDQWRLAVHAPLDDAGKPQLLLRKEPFSQTHVANLLIGSLSIHGDLIVLSADSLLSWASYESVPGIVGAAVIFGVPVLMDPATQTWVFLNTLKPEDLAGLNMANAAVLDILDPDSDGIPALAVQVHQGAAQFTDTMTLATGSPFTLLSVKAAQALKLTPEPQKLTYGAGKDTTVFNQAHLSQLSIGGVVLKDVVVAYPVGAMPKDFYPRLGMNVISQLRLLVDAPAKKMYVKKADN